jgi:hypothetical protein
VGLAFKGAPGLVGPGFTGAADPDDRDRVQGPVQCAVSAVVEAVPGALAAAGFQRCDSGQRGEGGFASDPSGVRNCGVSMVVRCSTAVAAARAVLSFSAG